MIDISDYKVSIYNRHGELISFLMILINSGMVKFNSDLTVPMGVYVYQIEFKNLRESIFTKMGTLL